MSCKSFSDLELKEVKGFMDLGFIFKKEQINPRSSSINGNQSWVDACQDQQHQQQQQQQQQFILSPSTPNYTSVPTTNRDFFNGSSSNYKSSSSSSSAIDDKFNDNGFCFILFCIGNIGSPFLNANKF